MFTGIVEELGEVVALETTPARQGTLTVRGPLVASDARPGGSIAVDGTCLTVVAADADAGTFSVEVMGETLARTTVGGYRPGREVNLERAVPAGGRLAGHIVQGHVDGTTTLLGMEQQGDWAMARYALPDELARYVAEKGSVALDGVSLTVATTDAGEFSIGLIPETLRRTSLGRKLPGDALNVEVDVVAKYVERLTASVERAR
ncbi:MAG: riboflavin synthase [Streptosporangiales bacterium]